MIRFILIMFFTDPSYWVSCRPLSDYLYSANLKTQHVRSVSALFKRNGNYIMMISWIKLKSKVIYVFTNNIEKADAHSVATTESTCGKRQWATTATRTLTYTHTNFNIQSCSLTECIVIVGVRKTGVVCLPVCVCVCLSVCVSVCLSVESRLPKLLGRFQPNLPKRVP